ncbi:MAG TPA: ATP-dependent DNA helicase RecG [Treponemataceae bacterium]|nr:ATP-dependent DNA helicase RecG [Treponemataceae bacterium]
MKLQDIETPVTSVSGIGPRFAKSLASLNIFTVYQLLTHYPRLYEDRTRLVHLKDFNNGEKVHTIAKVTAHEWFGYGRMKTLKIRIDDDTASAVLVCFNRPFLEKTYPVGSLISVTGNFSEKYGDLQSASFEAELIQKDGEEESISMPDNFYSIAVYYPLTAGLSQAQMQKFISTALHEYGKGINNEIPELYRLKYGLLSKQEAIHLIHKPSTLEEANKARQTLIYEELFLFQSGIVKRTLERKGSLPDAMSYAALTENSGASPQIEADNTVLQESFQRSLSPKQRQLADRLSFDLTPDQKSVILQMNRELDESFSGLSKFSMSRLLQGDVGSGKTLVAFFACLRVIDSGFQCAILSPTELLSRQHAENAALLLEPISGIRLAYLTGNIQAKGRNKLLTELSQGSIDIVIGTHALFSKNVQYKHLRFAVIDEQHRFGVIQRNMIIEKGRSPEGKPPSFLMMSATPIPQTLALTVFGDLDVSVIKSMPPGRKSIQTHLTREGNEARVYEAVRKEILSGHQAYFVYPLIEKADEETDQHDNLFDKKTDLKSAEDMFSFLQKEVYPEFSCALVHSKVDEEDQHRILSEFSKGKIQILVATTVVEVGVDVPNATCMVIEHAERFGLAALHQLRGRVGRGKAQSHCFLIYSNKLTDTGKERLKAMHETTDGFQIAELDLKLRGPGEVSGIQQSGSLLLGIADPLRDKDILLKARKDVYEHLTQQSKSLAH